ncbi:MAG TPA: hypothetical protein VGO04_03655 [Ensifer sp.]|jgi:hypothetical protein|uniref:hypothetical protein n=1 Tax=Ensifer sp. TaxID=1872086 RepID=UPI002E106344|nr:hypothetical protein [Ensifer sp.]
MTSKAERIRIKRASRAGRPRKVNVARYPSGQIKHGETEREVRSVALDARQRMHFAGKRDVDVASPFAGYTLGRMFLDGKLTAHEREAGDEYARQMARYYSLTGIPFPSVRAQSLFDVKGFAGETSGERARGARQAANRMMELEGALLKLPDGPQVKTTVFNVCIMDYEMLRTMPEPQLLWLKRGLKELHWHLGLSREKEAV